MTETNPTPPVHPGPLLDVSARPRLTYSEIRLRLVQGETLADIARSYPSAVERLRGLLAEARAAILAHCDQDHGSAGCGRALDIADRIGREVGLS